MKRQIWISMLAGLLFSAVTCTVWAQSTAQINGKVTDPSGAVLPGVEVTATQTDTGSFKRRSVYPFPAFERLDDFEWMSVGNPDVVAILLGDLRGYITDARHG